VLVFAAFLRSVMENLDAAVTRTYISEVEGERSPICLVGDQPSRAVALF
jgi:hypothetical protein